MPWDASTFASRHNHALHGDKATHAARIANAVLRSGAPEGESIAIANKWAQHHAMGGPIGYDGGGMIDPTAGSVAINQPTLGGMTPSPVTASPMIAQTMQRYAQIPVEKLHEMVMMMGNSPQGQIARRALMQKQMMPQVQQQAPAMGQAAGGYDSGGPITRERAGEILSLGRHQSPQTDINLTPSPDVYGPMQRPETHPSLNWLPQGMGPDTTPLQVGRDTPYSRTMHRAASGGSVAHRDMGGGMLGMSLSQADPYWTRSEERSANTAPMTGYLHGATAGRADALKGTALSDSYILPAEELAGLGEGNNLMGARVIDSMLNSGPHGIQQARPRGGHGPPHPPPAPREYQAKGGGVQHDDTAPTTKVALSHGEYSMTPEQVMQFTGRPTLESAHRVMDLFVMEQRKRHIKDLKGLEGPVGSKQ